MYKKILIALDLEGVNNVCGVAYSGLGHGSAEWDAARRQAADEVNCAARALFDAGAQRVAVWDNHGSGKNIIPDQLDPRIELIEVDTAQPRMYFAADGAFDCICFFGYHAMEGTLGGVLAHTMNSSMIQHYKLNGKHIGEVDMDAYIAASHRIPAVFFAGGDITCAQAKRVLPHLVTVVTKQELSRNEAVYKDNTLLFNEIKREITAAINTEMPLIPCSFPATLEKSFKRTEDAAKYLLQLREMGIEAEHPADDILGRDAHTVTATVHNISQFICCI
ncbi:MAG: M55 family metallopeptidase [Clostridia bacterium]|nr:M55 family metallopeptidase [Clostridia bacterium]